MFRTLSLLLLISLGYLTADIYLPSLPAITEYFSISQSTAQMTMFVYLISFASAPIVFGPVSDQYGRKKVILAGLVILLLGTIGCCFAFSIQQLLFFRLLQGVGSGALIISSRAMIPDLFKGATLARQVSAITMFMPLALSFAISIGGYLQQNFGWRSVFVFQACYVILILIKMRFVDESLKLFSERKMTHAFKSYRELLANRKFVLAIMGLGFPAVGLFAYLTVSPFLFQETLSITSFEYGRLALFTGGSVLLGSIINIRLLHYFKIDTLIWTGTALMACSGALLLIVHLTGYLTVWTVLLPACLYFLCLTFCVSNSISKAMGYITHSYGAASAIMTSFQVFAGSLGSFIFSMLPSNTVLPIALCFLLMSAFTAFSLLGKAE